MMVKHIEPKIIWLKYANSIFLLSIDIVIKVEEKWLVCNKLYFHSKNHWQLQRISQKKQLL
jgi:hypothetical protein